MVLSRFFPLIFLLFTNIIGLLWDLAVAIFRRHWSCTPVNRYRKLLQFTKTKITKFWIKHFGRKNDQCAAIKCQGRFAIFMKWPLVATHIQIQLNSLIWNLQVQNMFHCCFGPLQSACEPFNTLYNFWPAITKVLTLWPVHVLHTQQYIVFFPDT